jgi:DNA polymerase
MKDPSALTPDDLRRQAQQHLQSMQSAGVTHLPKARRGKARPAAADQAAAGPAAPLFDHDAISGEGAQPPRLTIEQRRHELQVLAEKVAKCTRCAELAATRTQTVFADGPASAELCFIGEAPGADEDAQGIPFVGAAGQLLNKILAACELKREEVYICNILRCRPPGNRTPLATEAASCREWLDGQLALVQPKYICTLGGCAAQNLLNTTQSLGKLRGRFHEYQGMTVMCTYHPAYLLPHRHPEMKKFVWEDMKMLLARMGRPVPGSRE